jgi:hypothetical protein
VFFFKQTGLYFLRKNGNFIGFYFKYLKNSFLYKFVFDFLKLVFSRKTGFFPDMGLAKNRDPLIWCDMATFGLRCAAW